MRFGFLWIAMGIGNAAYAASTQVPAIVAKVDGDGQAQVRKRSGIVESAGSRGKLFPGDRLLTDARAAASLFLSDGTVIKVGADSELQLEAVVYESRFLSWRFRLVRGNVRALVEPLPGGEEHVRIESAKGTVTARAGELVFSADGALFVRGGTAKLNAWEVKTGEFSAGGPAAPFAPKDLLAGEPRVSLFREGKRAPVPASTDEAGLQKVLDGGADLEAAQDRAIGRNKEDREALAAFVKKGAYGATLKAADAFAEARGIFRAGSNGGAEDQVAQVLAAKFRLGRAVAAADEGGLFADKPTKGKPREFRDRKEIEYAQRAEAKARREALVAAAEEYRATLEYAEAYDAYQISPSPDIPKGKDCDTDACVLKRIEHEVDVASEGSVNAFAGRKPESAPRVVIPKKGRVGPPGAAVTKYFSRAVPGDACFGIRHACKMVTCTSTLRLPKGAKCLVGKLVEICDPKPVPARCAD